jgi:hypothetical protein
MEDRGKERLPKRKERSAQQEQDKARTIGNLVSQASTVYPPSTDCVFSSSAFLTASQGPSARNYRLSNSDYTWSAQLFTPQHRKLGMFDLHVIIVPLDRERETAMNLQGVRHLRTSERATRQHGFLLLIEANGAELLPIRDKLVFHYDFVDCEFALHNMSA